MTPENKDTEKKCINKMKDTARGCQLFLSLVFVFVLSGVWVQRLRRIVCDISHDPQALGSSLTEQYSVSNGEELWPLHEAECDKGFVASSYKVPINVNDGACLTNGANMEHCLVFAFDGGRVR